MKTSVKNPAVETVPRVEEEVGRDLAKAQKLVERFLNSDGSPAESALALLAKANITDEVLGVVLSEGLKATQEISQGRDRGTCTVDDFYARHKYLLVALIMKGYVGGKGDGAGSNTFNKILNITCTAEMKKPIDIPLAGGR